MSRATLTDTVQDVIVKITEGNPGALSVCMLALQHTKTIDPQAAFEGLGVLLSFDDMGIYGSRIWMLYKDVCNQKIGHMLAILRARQLGFLPEAELQQAIDGQIKINVADLCTQVTDQLEQFQLEIVEV